MSETTLQPEVSSYKQMQKESGRCTPHWKGDILDHPDWMCDGEIVINTNSVQNKKYMNLLRNKKQEDRDYTDQIEQFVKDESTPKLSPADFHTYRNTPDPFWNYGRAIYRFKNSIRDIHYSPFHIGIISKLLECPVEKLLVNKKGSVLRGVFYRYAGFKDLGLPPDAIIIWPLEFWTPSRDTTKEID